MGSSMWLGDPYPACLKRVFWARQAVSIPSNAREEEEEERKWIIDEKSWTIPLFTPLQQPNGYAYWKRTGAKWSPKAEKHLFVWMRGVGWRSMKKIKKDTALNAV